MILRTWLATVALMLLLVSRPLEHAVARAQDSCAFGQGFRALHRLIPDVVGECVENERFNVWTRTARQRTSRGILVWRQFDNWTAFTDGYRTWVLGPRGLQVRLNSQRFAWEADAQPASDPLPTSELWRALLTIDDLPAGWIATPTPWFLLSGSTETHTESVCGLDFEGDWGFRNYEVGIIFAREEPKLSLYHSLQVSQVPGRRGLEEAIRFFVDLCPEWTYDAGQGITMTGRFSVPSSPTIGDEAAILRSSWDVPQHGTFISDSLVVRRGSVFSSIGYSAFTADFDPSESERYARLADGKLAALALRTEEELPADLLLHDSFDDPLSARLPGSSPEPDRYRLGYLDGEYVIAGLDPEWTGFPWARVPAIFSDATIGADVRFVGDAADRYASVTCRDQGGERSSHYRVSVAPARGEFTLGRWERGRKTDLVPWQKSSAIRPGNESNHLELRCAGATITVAVNGQPLATVQDSRYQMGYASIGADSFGRPRPPTEARFDNLVITAAGPMVLRDDGCGPCPSSHLPVLAR